MFGGILGSLSKGRLGVVAYAAAVGGMVALASYVLNARLAEGMRRTLRVKTDLAKLKGILNRYHGMPKVLVYFVAGGKATSEANMEHRISKQIDERTTATHKTRTIPQPIRLHCFAI